MKVPELHELELVDEGLAGRDMRLRQPADAVHADGRIMPCQWMVVCSGSLLVTKMRTLVALDRLDRRSRRLAVIAPEEGLHAGRHLALDRLGDEMELLDSRCSSARGRVQPFSVATGW
jgi:hypothetical protein